MKMDTKELSLLLGVSEKYVISFASMILNEMKKDNIDDNFLSLSEKQRCEVIQAYGSFVVNKFYEFYITYTTNTDVKSIFNDMIFANLKYNTNNNFVNVHWYRDSAINDLFVMGMTYVKGSGVGFVNGYKKIESRDELKISVKNENVWTMI